MQKQNLLQIYYNFKHPQEFPVSLAVKDPVWSPLCFKSLLWPGSFYTLWHSKKNKKKTQKNSFYFYFVYIIQFFLFEILFILSFVFFF